VPEAIRQSKTIHEQKVNLQDVLHLLFETKGKMTRKVLKKKNNIPYLKWYEKGVI